MNMRSHESPMDFEWQTSGPSDPTSPFHKASVNYWQNRSETPGKKRTHSVFESPLRPKIPSAATEPVLSQPYPFAPSTGSKPLFAFRNPSFTTPRKLEQDTYSSGPEVPSSPDNADAEDTPEPPSRTVSKPYGTSTAMTAFTGTKSEKKAPLFGNYGFNLSGRGEIRRGKYADAVVRKVRKRRRHDTPEQRLQSRRSSADTDGDDSDDNLPSSRHPSGPAPSTLSSLPTLFNYLESHPSLPHILSFYAQLTLNIFLVAFFIYLVYSFYATIRSDVDQASEDAAAEILAEMATCAQQFVDNRCERGGRVPAMESVCQGWERCMQRDPKSVGRAKVSAKTFAEIFNSFVEPISYKAMIFTCTLIFGCIAISNFAFGFFRQKASGQTHHFPHLQHHHQSGYEHTPGPHPPPPAYYNQNQSQTPYGNGGQDWGSQHAHQGWGRAPEPTRRKIAY
ncbi:MAG: hypothetical protein M1817_002809 [Caeruleum heppii]|nr:MAG: hypothetical protein M1817_002809 [Caeruleum heppii]